MPGKQRINKLLLATLGCSVTQTYIPLDLGEKGPIILTMPRAMVVNKDLFGYLMCVHEDDAIMVEVM